MKRLAMAVTAALLAGCAQKEATPEAAPAEPVAAPAPAPIDLATVAGTWEFKTMSATSDSVLTTGTLVATATTDGWTMTLPKRKPVTLTIMVSGDSIMAQSPPYESVLRKGVTVNTSTVYHLVEGKLMGTTTAHYSKGADSVLALRTEGVRKVE